MDYLTEAKKLLNNEYREKYALAHTDYQIDFMNEKIKHSYQVLGAGNYLLKHEPCFANLSLQEKSYYQAIVLLHDICRFYEILEKEKGNFIDHGIAGAEFLAKTKLFCNQDVTLPIKHHGHLIEKLYEDKEYQQLSSAEQQHIQKIAFLVRDADKLANLYLITSQFEKMSPLFFVENNYQTPHSKHISEDVKREFFAHDTVNLKYMTDFAERALGFISWIYDINYISSFIFLEKLHLIEKLFDSFSIYMQPQDCAVFKQEIEQFIATKKGR